MQRRGMVRSLLAALAICAALPTAQANDAQGEAELPRKQMLVWLRADAPGDIGAMDTLPRWKNLSDKASGDATQSDPKRRPRRIAQVDGLAGQPAIEFDGVDDFMDLPWLRLGVETTLFLVAENAPQTTGGSHWRTVLGGRGDSFRAGATTYAFGFRRGDYDPSFLVTLYYAADKPHLLMQPASTALPVRFQLYQFRRSAQGEMLLRTDGEDAARLPAAENPSGFPGAGYTLGQGGDVVAGRPSRFYRGRVAELIAYDRSLAVGESLRVEEYLAAKYRLRRIPAPVAAGISLWLNADSLPPARKNEPVALWRDDSGRNRDARQSLAGKQPVRVPRAMNGRPAVDFAEGRKSLALDQWNRMPQQTAFAAIRREPDERPEIVRQPFLSWMREQGKRGPFAGQLGELLVYDRDLTRAEANEVIGYLADRYLETTDPRWFNNGRLIFRNGYNDQPYVVHCRDDSWLCVITTGEVEERGADRTLVVTRSRDHGHTWSEPRYAIEPREGRMPSWATLYVTSYGRVYVLYNLRDELPPKPAGTGFYFKYSDDHGETWSTDRYRIPIRSIAIDTRPGITGGWSVCPPIQVGDEVLVSYARFAAPGRSNGQGFVFRSDNLASQRDPAKIHWEMLPAGDRGLRVEGIDSTMQEEHIITPLADGSLCCLWRSTSGYACQSYSRDGGRTWEAPGYATYTPGGRRIKHPLACFRPFRTSDGRYLLWFHNTRPQGPTSIYRPRDVVWLAGGQERAGRIEWSAPEILLYGFDLPVSNTGMSYPDFIEQDGKFWVTTTDKEDARVFSLEPAMLAGLWRGEKSVAVPNGCLLDLKGDALASTAHQPSPRLPSLLHGGFTIDLTIKLDNLHPGQTVAECRGEHGQGWIISTASDSRLRVTLNDSRNEPATWYTDPGLLVAGKTHHIGFIIEGGPNLILAIVDGQLCDGGDIAMCGWGRFSRHLTETTDATSRLSFGQGLVGLRLFDRPLRVAEAIAVQRSAATP